jgi:hypothetical protein
VKHAIVALFLIVTGCAGISGGDEATGSVSLEDQLARLDQLGVRFRPGIGKADLLMSWDRSEYEALPFVLVLTAMGGEVGKEPFPRISDDVWHFDVECIEDHGAYVAIAERIRYLAGGKLALSNLRDYVDVERQVAWLAFTVGEQAYRWDLKADHDYVDPDVFARFDQVLAEHAPDLRLIYYDLGGQDCLILMGDSSRMERLRTGTGLNFVWMNQ